MPRKAINDAMTNPIVLLAASTALLASSACASLLGESFDGYEVADAGTKKAGATKHDSGTDAGGDSPGDSLPRASEGGQRDASVDAGHSTTEPSNREGDAAAEMTKQSTPEKESPKQKAEPTGSGADSDAGPDDAREVPPLGTHCDGTPALEVAMRAASELDDWQVTSTETPTPVARLTFVADQGSPEPGAGLLNPHFTGFNQSVKVGIVRLAPRALDCISVRVKVVGSPNNPQLANERAGWLLWSVDNSSCYAQAELPGPPWYHFELSKADQWYELGWQGDKLVGANCMFNPRQVGQVGVGFVSGSAEAWDAKFLIDTLRLY